MNLQKKNRKDSIKNKVVDYECWGPKLKLKFWYDYRHKREKKKEKELT